MRMNTRNLILMAVLVVAMIVMVFLGTRPEDLDPADPLETAGDSGALFPDADENAINRFEIRQLPAQPPADATEAPTATEEPTEGEPAPDPAAEIVVVMTKDDADIWTISEATNATEREADQTLVVGTMSIVAGYEYSDRITSVTDEEARAAFGLVPPQYEIVLADDTNTYRLFLGDKNPGGSRYYAQLEGDSETVYLLNAAQLDNVVNYVNDPPYVPPPTATPTPTATPNPFSEVEQTATAQAALDATATMQAGIIATAESVEVGPEAPADETEEATEEP